MRRILRARLLASALALSAIPLVVAAVPAQAQMDVSVNFDSFHDQLASHGYWLYSDRWGMVWQPRDVPDDFRPYFSDGHWVDTQEYGWTWASDYDWGDIPFHYGRWVNDPDDGWMWIPGYTWSPGWVTWRSNGQYLGWMPAPPDDDFLQGRSDVSVVGISLGIGGVSFNVNSDPYYGYRRWYPDYDDRRFASNWVFVGVGHVADRDYRPYRVNDSVQVVNIIRQTRNITNYTVVNNYVVNRSVDVRLVERASGRRVEVAPVNVVFRRPSLIATVDVGQRAMLQARETAPRGFGMPNSAPKPPPTVVDKLSVQVNVRSGRAPSHLFTQSTVVKPEVQNRFQGPAAGHPGPNGMTGPGGMPAVAPAGSPPAGETPRRLETGQPKGTTAPSGMMGPAGEATPAATPTPETRHHRVQTPPGGMTAPGGTTGAGGMSGPTGETTPAAPSTPEPKHHRVHTAPGEMTGPSGTTGAGSMSGPTAAPPPATPPAPETRHRRVQTPPSDMSGPATGAGGMSGPTGATPTDNGAPPASETRRHRVQTPPGEMTGPTGAGGMSGPAGNAAPPASETRRQREPSTPGSAPMSSPMGAPTSEPAHVRSAPPTAVPPTGTETPPPKKKKKDETNPPPGQ